MDCTDLKSHAPQQQPIIRGKGSRAEQRPEHVEGQRGQNVSRGRLQDVTLRKKDRENVKKSLDEKHLL